MIGDGVDVEPISAGVIVLPHASSILAGAPGFVALAGHETVDDPLAGAVRLPLSVTLYV